VISDVAALFVDARGSYPAIVEQWWCAKRDARLYDGALPVVAHPPCQRWCRLAGMVEARWGHKRGEDGGMFASALASLRRVGGVLEHPAYSDAWKAYALPKPPFGGGWTEGANPGEWTCYVEQFRYGHMAKKATWLYYVGASKPFDLRWGGIDDHTVAPPVSWTGNLGETNWRNNAKAPALISYAGNRVNGHRENRGPVQRRPRLTKKQASATPREFLDELIRLAQYSRKGLDNGSL
jgi:hypothetical protein